MVSGTAVEEPAYERFRIEAKSADHAYNVPSKFDVHAKRLRLAAMLVHETIRYRFNRDIVLSRPCIYGVFSGRLGGFKPIKQRCVGCMRCVQEYPHIMQVNYGKKYRELGDLHWTPESVFTILYESSTGKILSKEWGTREASAVKDGTASGRTCRRSSAQQETEFSAENTSQRLPTLEANRSFSISHLART